MSHRRVTHVHNFVPSLHQVRHGMHSFSGDICAANSKMDFPANTGPYDVSLVVKDGKEFKAHRRALSEASPFFEKLLSCDMKEKNEGVIRLEILTDSQMADVLEFIYSGKVEILTEENAASLIEAADYLCFSSLKQKAGNFLEQNLSTSSCLCVHRMAVNYLCEELIASSQKFICSNFSTVAGTEHFLNLSCDEIEKWISSDDIVIDTEEDVFKIVLRWIDHDKSERSVKFSELFRHVRLTFVPRDFLINDVVTNDLVARNKDCMDGVTSALAWIDRVTNCDVPRPHTARKDFETSVIAVTAGGEEPFHTSFYSPHNDALYRLPQRTVPERPPEHIISCRGKLFAVSQDIDKSQCYDPDLNRWYPAPWATSFSKLESLTDEHKLTAVLVVKSEICFIVESSGANFTWLWKYDLDANSTVLPIRWLHKRSACLVAEGRFIYVLGGFIEYDFSISIVPHCARYDTKEKKWQDIASLKLARYQACGVATNEKIYISGGHGDLTVSTTCEMYNVDADEWHFIAPSSWLFFYPGSLVLLDGTLHAISQGTSDEWTVECYDLGKDKWNIKTRIPVSANRTFMWEQMNACSLTLYKGVLANLQPAYIEEMEKPQPKEPALTQYAEL